MLDSTCRRSSFFSSSFAVGILTAGVALLVLFSVVITLWLRNEERKRVINEISRFGATVTADGRIVMMPSASFCDNDLQRLAPFLDAAPDLRVLVLANTAITDASVGRLKALHDSKDVVIVVDNTLISDKGRCMIQGVPLNAEDAKRLLQMGTEESVREVERLYQKRRRTADDRSQNRAIPNPNH